MEIIFPPIAFIRY